MRVQLHIYRYADGMIRACQWAYREDKENHFFPFEEFVSLGEGERQLEKIWQQGAVDEKTRDILLRSLRGLQLK